MEKVELPEHFLMAPSSASRWLKCPGSLRVPVGEDTAGEAAEIGTLGHAMVAAQLQNKYLTDEQQRFFDGLSEYVKADLEEGAALCVDFVRKLKHKTKLYEYKTQSQLIEEHGGTADVIAVNGTEIHVVDFKFGKVVVEIENNAQIKCYLNLARQLFPGRRKFIGTIIQPYHSDKPSTLEFSSADLDEHDRAVLRASVSSEFVAGDHCRYCHHLPTCAVAAKRIHDEIKDFPDLVKLVADAGEKPSEEYVRKISTLYQIGKMGEAAAEGAGDILKRWARKGVDLQPAGLGIRISHRTEWNEHAESVLRAQDIDPAVWEKRTIVSPSEVRAALGLSKEAFAADFSAALNQREIESLVMGKGGQKNFPEFD